MEAYQLEKLMERAIEVAKQSTAEDDRHHPLVGAVLVDAEGKELLYSFRGQAGDGAHAEYVLIESAIEQNIDLSDKTLFVTLEPCSRRSPKKLPCAVRVARSGIKTVYVGTLDPNPQIIGRGVNFLIAEGVRVEHFPARLRHKLIDLNAAFLGTHGYLVDPIVSDIGDVIAARQRDGILATTLDLIAFASGEIRVFTGDTSWLKELFVGLLEASLNGCRIKMLAQKPLSEIDSSRAAAIGIDVFKSSSDRGIRATLSMRDGLPSNLVIVEKSPARHAQIFSAPHDSAVLQIFSTMFDEASESKSVHLGSKPILRSISVENIAQTLRTNVPSYAHAGVELLELDIDKLLFLSNDVEIFKLRRVASTNRIMRKLSMEAPMHIVGTPWGFFPPIVERDSYNRLVVIDGNHRIYQARLEGRQSIKALVVSGATAPLPATPIRSWEPKIIPMKRSREDRYSSYDAGAFRPIRKALEMGSWVLDQLPPHDDPNKPHE